MSLEFIKKAKAREKKCLEVEEIDIEKDFVDYAKKKGCRAEKIGYLYKRGFLDRSVFCPGGRVFFIEFKRKHKTLTTGQSKVKKMLESLGFECYVCDEKGQAEKILDNFLFREGWL